MNPELAKFVQDLFSRLEPSSDSDPLKNGFYGAVLQSGFSQNEIERLKNEIFGRGPLDTLLANPDVTEIILEGIHRIWVEKNGQLLEAGEKFLSPITFDRVVQGLLFEARQCADQRFPFADGILENGVRLHVIMPPLASFPVISLRKHTAMCWELKDLLGFGGISERHTTFLRHAVESRTNILIAGPTSSGKTTLLRALARETPLSQRLIFIEDTPELKYERPNAAFLHTRRDVQKLVPDISLDDLLKNALRMRPDRIILGEVRGTEAVTLLDMLSTGHAGSMCTLHAHSARQALQRLEGLVLRGAPTWSLGAVRRVIQESIQIIVVTEKTAAGLRHIKEIARPAGVEDFGILLEPLDSP